MSDATEAPAGGSVRVDKWLWAARCFKTRSQAGNACDGGHVKVNGGTAKASQKVKPGDEIDVETPGGRRLLEVVALGEKRGSAEVARSLYLDHTPEEPKVERELLFEVERGEGRPRKRDRRRLERDRGW